MKKKENEDQQYKEEFADEVINSQIQDMYEDGTVDRNERTAKKTGSVKGDKKNSGPNYPAT
ncbi:hypothetical protein P6709_14410 [Jeotgalibacillus sp. ET6]|uniref:hypothetical protein n=1 Tax=Jeotgalibacillus sp. ET6 TaxID=3037260 RepID=UPI00241840D7|nr:hypothetical protein [Jeotgalibacillus sp. ET6]MDG5472943.1 hypothetical protein [Jeotgalibacillus sp. ET6]